MSNESRCYTAKEYYGDFYQLENFMESKIGTEEFWYWPVNITKGFLYNIKLRNGMLLSITDHYSTVPITINFDEHSPFFAFFFILTGNVNGKMSHISSSQEYFSFHPSEAHLYYTPLSSGVARYPNHPYRNVTLAVKPWLLKQFITPESPLYVLLDSLETSPQSISYYHQQLCFTPTMNMRLYEILNCTYSSGTRRHCFLESKALELLLLSTGELAESSQSHQRFPLWREEYPFVEKTRELLLNSMAAPPSLDELSQHVGVNKSKLNTCFREVYGTSIFEYLRICRLEKAKSLLQSGCKNVTEVALEVGYSEQSTFSKQFKKYFGVPPRNCLDF